MCSYYITKKTLEAIADLFEGAHEIKAWLRKCSQIIGGQNDSVKWITPMGLPCIQPYRKTDNVSQINTIVSTVMILESEDNSINKQKQQSAFPPNYIHSLDSTHMMYTSVECKKLYWIIIIIEESLLQLYMIVTGPMLVGLNR